mgnify:CR=1 FL=1
MTIRNITNGKVISIDSKTFNSWKPEMQRRYQVVSKEDTAVKEEVVISKVDKPETGTKKK